MLDSKELMRGNWIEMINGKPDQVVDVMCDSVNTINGGGTLDDISGILLSPEILEKAGFNVTTPNADGSFNMWGRHIDASIDIEEGEVYRYRIFGRLIKKSIIYVHQLQNLYFALTGNELKITLLK